MNIETYYLKELFPICRELELEIEIFDKLDANELNIIISFYKKYKDDDKKIKIEKIIDVFNRWHDFCLKYRGNEEIRQKIDMIYKMIKRLTEYNTSGEITQQEIDDAPYIIYEIIDYVDTFLTQKKPLAKSFPVSAILRDSLNQTKTIIELHKKGNVNSAFVLGITNNLDEYSKFEKFFLDNNYFEVSKKMADTIMNSFRVHSENASDYDKKNFIKNMSNIIDKIYSNTIINESQKNRILDAIATKREYIWINLSQAIYKLIEKVSSFMEEGNPINSEIYVSFLEKIIGNMYDGDINKLFISRIGNQKFESYMIESFSNVEKRIHIDALRKFQIDYLNTHESIDEEKAKVLFNNVSKAIIKTENNNYIKVVTDIALKIPELPENILNDISNAICSYNFNNENLTIIEDLISLLLNDLTDNTEQEIYNKIIDFIKLCNSIAHSQKKLRAIKDIYEQGNLSLDDLMTLVNLVSTINNNDTIDLIKTIAINAEEFNEEGLKNAISYVIENNSALPYDKITEWLINKNNLQLLLPNSKETCITTLTIRVFDLYKYASDAEIEKMLIDSGFSEKSNIELRYTISKSIKRVKTKIRDRKSRLTEQ